MIVKRLHTTLNLLAKDPLLGGRNKAGTLRVKLSESSDFLFGLPYLHHHQVKGIPPRINIQWKKYQANILPLLSSLVTGTSAIPSPDLPQAASAYSTFIQRQSNTQFHQ